MSPKRGHFCFPWVIVGGAMGRQSWLGKELVGGGLGGSAFVPWSWNIIRVGGEGWRWPIGMEHLPRSCIEANGDEEKMILG